MELHNSVVWICVYLMISVAVVELVNGSGIIFDAALIILNLSMRMSMGTAQSMYLNSFNQFIKAGCKFGTCGRPLSLLQHYFDLGCEPVFTVGPLSRPVRYNCSHLKNKDKCFVHHQEYNIGDVLRAEDSNDGEIDCICTYTTDGFATFQCMHLDEYCGIYKPSEPGCYKINYPYSSCYQEVCLEKPRDVPKCHLSDGRVYKHGEYFMKKNIPDYTCICQPSMYPELGNAGSLIGDFCWKQNRPFWSNLHASTQFYRNCVPLYAKDEQQLTSNQHRLWRCPADDDYMRPTYRVNFNDVPVVNMCKFGKLIMLTGQYLNKVDVDDCHYSYCVCFVPPVPTCLLLKNLTCKFNRNRSWEYLH